ncbi:MAG: GUN4 domain-containing protein [Cyanobacteria bacterium P01_D01_bin.128]
MTQPPPPKPTFEERLSDGIFKLLVAGSGGYALYNLYLEDVPKAAISGLVAFGSGLMTSFGQGLMKALTNRMKQRGEASGKFIDRAVDNTVNKTLTRLTGFHRQYLEALKTRCVDLNVEGYGGLPRLALEDIYVALRMHPGGQGNPMLQNRNLTIWNILPKADDPDDHFLARLMAVVADPGYGKTTLMQFLTLNFSNQGYVEKDAKELIPVLLLFRDFHGQIKAPNEPKLPQLIVETVQKLPRCEDLRASEPWFKEKLQQGKCLVMLDGHDEVPNDQRQLASQWADWQMQNYPSQFILTSRPHGFNSSLFKGVERIDVLDFNDDQKRTFIEKWYRFIAWETKWKYHLQDSQDKEPGKQLSEAQARAQSQDEADRAAADLRRQLFADRSLIDLAKNPLLLTIIAVAHKFKERLPQRRLDVYREIFKLLLEDRPFQRQTRLTITNAADNQMILQPLALELTRANATQFRPRQGADWIKTRLAEFCRNTKLTSIQFLQEIQQVSGLLAGGEGYLYEFTHKTFQEYLAAVELSEHELGQPQVLTHLTDETWKEVVYFYALLTDPVPFIKSALEITDNLPTLELAQRIADDARSINETLKQQLRDARQKHQPETAAAVLEQRFQQLVQLSKNTALSQPITLLEYSLFIDAQIKSEFHSTAATTFNITKQVQRVDHFEIRWQDAQWFCAWLATQAQLITDSRVYDYRLPASAELNQMMLRPGEQPWTNDSKQLGNSLRVVRQRLPDRYRELVNYLASGSWQEADQETDKLMLKAVGKKAEQRGYLELEEVRNFPAKDLLLIDRLWVKFSGGKFGFSVQKQIWIEVGGTLDFNEDIQATYAAYDKMSDRNGWRIDGSYIPYIKVTFNTTAPLGHLPSRFRDMDGVGWFLWFSLLFARI